MTLTLTGDAPTVLRYLAELGCQFNPDQKGPTVRVEGPADLPRRVCHLSIALLERPVRRRPLGQPAPKQLFASI